MIKKVDHKFFVLLVLLSSGCRSPYYSDHGALLGGVTGAGVGAIAGDALGETLAGAAIGTAVGAVSGAAIGNGLDHVNARNQMMIDQRIGQRQVSAPTTTVADVVAMSRSGLSDDVIIQQFQSAGSIGPLSSSDLVALRQQGVSNGVIRAMQSLASRTAAPYPATSYPVATADYRQPVFVEEHYWQPGFAPRPVIRPHFGYHHGPRHPRCGRVGWGISIH